MVKTHKHTTWLLAWALILLVLSLFGQTRSFAFVNYDDPWLVLRNPHVASGLSWANFRWAFTSLEASNWHPLTWLSLQADVSLFGCRPGPMHLVNVGLHLAATLLLFQGLRELTGSRYRSALVAALFAIHPLHVESVAWVSERKDVLSSCFWMATLLAYVRYTTRPARWRYALVLALFALGLMAKPMLVTLPFVLLILDYWPLGRLRIEVLADWRGCLLDKAPLIALSLASCAITLLAQRGAMSTLEEIPLPLRLLWGALACVRYLLAMAWPRNLVCFYSYPSFQASILPGVAALALLFVASWVCFRARERHPHLLFGWAWFLLTLLPVIGLVQVGAQAMADRYTYLPLIGPLIALVWAGEALATRLGWTFKAKSALSLAVLLALYPLAYAQVGVWRNDLTLFGHATQVTSGNLVARDLYANALLERGLYQEALGQFQAFVALAPHRAAGYYGSGDALLLSGKPREAIQNYRLALVQEPKHPLVRYQLALALRDSGHPEAALAHLQVLETLTPPGTNCGERPTLGSLRLLMGDLTLALGHPLEAARYYRLASEEPKCASRAETRLKGLRGTQAHLPHP